MIHEPIGLAEFAFVCLVAYIVAYVLLRMDV